MSAPGISAEPILFLIFAAVMKRISESRAAEAAERKRSGEMNCAQAVAVTYADVAGVSQQTMVGAAASFGSGMGTMHGTCGALIGAGIVYGMMVPDRVKARAGMKRIFEGFEKSCGATICCDLKLGTGTNGAVACEHCVAEASRLLESVVEDL